MAHRAALRATDRFERKREAILDAATAILNRRGVKGLTLGVAAAAVDLSTTSVTYYFKRKDDLAAACMLRGIEALTQMVEAALAEQTPRARLHLLLTLYLERVGCRWSARRRRCRCCRTFALSTSRSAPASPPPS